jgi:hypothetical protein
MLPRRPNILTLDELRRKIERLCRDVAPRDLAGRPLYVLFSSQLSTGIDADHYGLTVHSLDLVARPHIDWQGRGPAFLINDRAIFADVAAAYPKASRSGRLWLFERQCIATGLHEFAHILERGTTRGEPPSALVMTEVREAFRKSNDRAISEPAASIDLHHGPKWIRAALHILSRVNLSGPIVFGEDIVGNADRGLSPAHEYFAALEGETERLREATFATIAATPMPPAFAELHRRDSDKLIQTAA